MLEARAVSFKTRRRASQLAALVGAFAALRVRAPRLLDAVAETLKQPGAPGALSLTGPWESVVLVWAVGRLAAISAPSTAAAAAAAAAPPTAMAPDPVLWTLLQEHAATQVHPASMSMHACLR